VNQPITALIAGGVLVLVAALASSPARAARDYPPGLFENFARRPFWSARRNYSVSIA
jgi:hypothetical protein